LFDIYANSKRKKKIVPIIAPILAKSFNDSVDKGILFPFAITFSYLTFKFCILLTIAQCRVKNAAEIS